MDEHEKRIAKLRAEVAAAVARVAVYDKWIAAYDAWIAADAAREAADDKLNAARAALAEEDRYPEPADMSGPDGPVADSSDGYKIRPGEEARRDDA